MSPRDNPPSTAVDPVLDAFRAGHQTLLISGRTLFDLHVNKEGEIRPLRQTLMRRAKEEFGMATLLFNLALGPRWNWEGFSDKERKDYEQKLQTLQIPLRHGIQAGADHRNETHERAFLLLAALYRSIEQGAELPPLLTLWEFGEDLAPENERGHSNDWIIQISELLQLLSQDYQRRRHRLLLVLSGIPERMDRRVVNCLVPVHLSQPDRTEKLEFIATLREKPHAKGASFADGLTDEAVANLTARTPNQGIEASFFQSSQTKNPITHSQLVERKQADVVALSDGTLGYLDTERVRGVKLDGRTIERVVQKLRECAEGLKLGNPYTPANVLLAGAPSTGKTDAAVQAGFHSQTPTYQFINPKASFVGQSERNVRLQLRIFKDLSPAFGFVDEITESLQMERSSMNLDSGASNAIMAEWMTALSDTSRQGRTLLVATTNCPWLVGSAMASRFLFIPVLSAVEEDYPAIVCAIASHLLSNFDWDPNSESVKEAARVFYQKGAIPRIIRSILSSKIGMANDQQPLLLLKRAAQDCAPQSQRDRAGAEYADLYAIDVCSDLSLLPWHDRISNYPLPKYLRRIVSERDGSVDRDRLHDRLEELKPHVNV